jgi:hypothetical protein
VGASAKRALRVEAWIVATFRSVTTAILREDAASSDTRARTSAVRSSAKRIE